MSLIRVADSTTHSDFIEDISSLQEEDRSVLYSLFSFLLACSPLVFSASIQYCIDSDIVFFSVDDSSNVSDYINKFKKLKDSFETVIKHYL